MSLIQQVMAVQGRTDSDALAWRAAVVSNGGSVSSTTMRAVNEFCAAAKGFGLWTKLTRVNLVCGDQLAAAQVPLKAGGGGATETLTNIVAGDYVETGATAGVKGNGTSKSFSPGWNPVARSASTSSFGVWAYVKGTEAAGTSRMILGHADATPNSTLLGWADSGTREAGALGVFATSEYAPSGASAAKQGFLGVCTNGSRAQQYYQDGVAVGAAVTAAAGFANSSIEVLAYNNNGTIGNWSTRYLRAYAFTTGMSAAEGAAFNTIMQRFQASLGRQV